nr:hypothetical protein CFP56_30083 [Quercus suber]
MIRCRSADEIEMNYWRLEVPARGSQFGTETDDGQASQSSSMTDRQGATLGLASAAEVLLEHQAISVALLEHLALRRRRARVENCHQRQMMSYQSGVYGKGRALVRRLAIECGIASERSRLEDKHSGVSRFSSTTSLCPGCIDYPPMYSKNDLPDLSAS